MSRLNNKLSGTDNVNDYAISATQLTRNFSNLTAVSALDLQVEKQTIYGFLGPNGSGKTTAIRLLTGLLKPSSGEVNILGCNLPKEAQNLRMKIGYMTQKFSLYDDLTVKENLQFVSKIYGLTPNEQKARLSELLSVHQLTQQSNQFADSMSGGQKQRLALAASVIHKPKLLFLDEPTSAVDPQNRREFWEQLFDLCDQGTTILVSTHYMDEAERCHKLAILENGIKRADDTPQNLMDNMAAQIVEIGAKDLRHIKDQLIQLPQVVSAAQLGTHLRVLVNKAEDDPVALLQQQPCLHTSDKLALVRPSLEDVFVSCTNQKITDDSSTTSQGGIG
ncbi:ABC transporter ATP-binding protein [Colwellia sp. E2M01]|uniref:ABC transporter ATP-binding protein n=1 Tax=Colwellia sp. E2M01 TaxID=2841561 RepID=UPI001C08BF77|nr:ABC transporter ATP-binding protein [Colwellia sp. E2M01]MBU2869413.1 ABC transporter ATP-binding protein [Colwellia sp. E2M01]